MKKSLELPLNTTVCRLLFGRKREGERWVEKEKGCTTGSKRSRGPGMELKFV